MDCYERGNEPFRFIRGEEFLGWLNDYLILKHCAPSALLATGRHDPDAFRNDATFS
jgi:hypothetical protein